MASQRELEIVENEAEEVEECVNFYIDYIEDLFKQTKALNSSLINERSQKEFTAKLTKLADGLVTWFPKEKFKPEYAVKGIFVISVIVGQYHDCSNNNPLLLRAGKCLLRGIAKAYIRQDGKSAIKACALADEVKNYVSQFSDTLKNFNQKQAEAITEAVNAIFLPEESVSFFPGAASSLLKTLIQLGGESVDTPCYIPSFSRC